MAFGNVSTIGLRTISSATPKERIEIMETSSAAGKAAAMLGCEPLFQLDSPQLLNRLCALLPAYCYQVGIEMF
jgi:hypothetical protein